MNQTPILIHQPVRDIADIQRAKRAESLAAYIRRLIVEDGKRNNA